jgi:natural product biosynthesis luciferase-like monooxygenase protein
MVHFSQLLLCDRRQEVSSRERYEQLLDEVRLLDRMGYETAWFAEHHFAGYALVPNCLMIAAAAARETSRIRLGAGVVVLPFHHPVRVAEEAAMVDCLSNGRLDLGFGRGYQPIEFEGFGQTLEESQERYADALKVVLDILNDPDGPGNYDTPRFKGRGAALWPKPVQRPIPYWGASISEASFTRYGKLGWPILTFPANQDPAELRRQIDVYRETYVAAGHDPARMRVGLTMFTYVNEDQEEADQLFEAGMRHYFGFLHGITKEAEEKQGSFYVEIPTLARLSGNPETVRNRIRELTDYFGATDVLNMSQFYGYLSHEQTLGSIRLFADQVMPAFQERSTAGAAR